MALRTGPFGTSLHKKDYVAGGVPVINPMHIADGRITPTVKHAVSLETADRLGEFKVCVGDVVIGRRGEMGRCAVVTRREAGWLCGTGSLLIRSSDGIDPYYLQRFLSSDSVGRYLRQESVGSTMANLNQEILLSLNLALPPAAEQVRIVDKIDELFSDLEAGVAELKAAQKKLSQYRQSLLKAAIDGSLTASWRETQRQQQGEPQETGAQLLERILTERRARWEAKQLTRFAEHGRTPPKGWKAKYPEPQRPDLTRLPNLPEGWVWASVDQCVVDETAITDGPFGSNLKSSHYRETGPRVIRLQNIGDGVFLDARAHISDEHYDQLLKHAVAAGDLVVAMLGEGLPRACIVPPGIAPAIVKADCARLRLNTELIRPAVMNAALNSPPVRERAVSLMKGIGRPRINLGALRSIAIPVCPSLEQIALESQLAEAEASIEEMHSTIVESLTRSQAQRQNILKAAFSGQLVLQDPNDEPASVLLERIRAERTAAGVDVRIGKRGRKSRGQS